MATVMKARVVGVAACLPKRMLFRSPFRQTQSASFSGMARLYQYTAVLVALGWCRHESGGRSAAYFWRVWMVPLGTSFP